MSEISVKITDRDEKLFNFLHRLKYASIDQMAQYLCTTNDAMMKRLSLLSRAGYLERTYYLEGEARVQRRVVYSNGYEVRKNYEKKSQRRVKINFITLKHHLLINDVFINLVKSGQVKEENIVTEREIYKERTGIITKKKLTKVSDLVLKIGERLVAIEVEKTKKVKDDLISTFNNLDYNTEYYMVVYICATKPICEYVKKIANEEGKTFIEVYTLKEFYKEGIKLFNLNQ